MSRKKNMIQVILAESASVKPLNIQLAERLNDRRLYDLQLASIGVKANDRRARSVKLYRAENELEIGRLVALMENN